MPHDRRGQLIEEGDIVHIPARVVRVHEGTDYCNLTLETIEPMHPGVLHTSISLNAKQVEKL